MTKPTPEETRKAHDELVLAEYAEGSYTMEESAVILKPPAITHPAATSCSSCAAKDAEITRLTEKLSHEVLECDWAVARAESAEAKLKQIRELIVREREDLNSMRISEYAKVMLDDLLRALDAMETK